VSFKLIISNLSNAGNNLDWPAVHITAQKLARRDIRPAQLLAARFVIVTGKAQRRQMIERRECIAAVTDRQEVVDRFSGDNKLPL
jgi:hypothetical protein